WQGVAWPQLRLGRDADQCRDPQCRNDADQTLSAHLTTSRARIAVWPAPHGREHSMTNRPTVSAVYFTTVSPRRRLGIVTSTSVPMIRKPWSVSSLVRWNSTTVPVSTVISAGV